MTTIDTADVPGDGLRARKRRALRARLIEIAGRRFSRSGYDATNMRDIADEAGIAYQTLYNHFPNKARLAFAWLSQLMDDATSRTDALQTRSPGDPIAAILAAADLYVGLVDGLDRKLWREATSEYFHAPAEASAMNTLKLLGPHARLLEHLRAEHAAGVLRPHSDVETLADVLYVLIDHAVLRFVVIEDMTREAVLATLRAQIELVLRPSLVAPRTGDAGA